ncbi:hypothetical protein KCU98_g11158, partial [Aureobasidium melanogenum]
MANNSSSVAGTHAPSNIPGLSEEIRNLRRPLNTGAYYSCSQQEWDYLCRQTLVLVSKAKATTALTKKSRAGKIHETADGEAALTRCSACTKGNNGNGYDCYLSSNGTTKTCAHCAFSNKSKCNAQRAPAGANNSVAPAPAVAHPVVAPAPALPAPALTLPAVTHPAFVASQAPYPAFFAPPVQSFVSGPTHNGGWAPVAAYQPLPPREWTEEDLEYLTDVEMTRLFDILRRDHENQQRQ